MFKFSLGQQVRDTITGVAGTVTARGDYLASENRRYEVSPRCDASGKPVEAVWLDEARLESHLIEPLTSTQAAAS